MSQSSAMYSPPDRHRYHNISNMSSVEQLHQLLDAIIQWRRTYDAANHVFPEIWRRFNDEYESHISSNDMKEGELSPIYSTANQEKKRNVTTSHNNTLGGHQEYDPTQDTDLYATWQQMARNQLQQNQPVPSIQPITKPHTLNASAKAFVSVAESPKSRLPTIAEEPTAAVEPSANSLCETNSIYITNAISYYPPPPLAIIQSQNAIIVCNALPVVPSYCANNIPNCSPVTQVTQRTDVTAPVTTCTDHRETRTPTNDGRDPKVMDFKRKFSNHANGNFFVGEDITQREMEECMEPFDDSKLAYYYTKQSIAMQINEKRIHIMECNEGEFSIIHIDLHFKNGDEMYLIAMQNDINWRHKVPWRVMDLMTATQIARKYNVHRLPTSCRGDAFQKALKRAPVNVSADIIWRTNFKTLPKKMDDKLPRTRISEYYLKRYCHQSWNDGIVVPVVVIKGKRQWIEWKKFIKIYDERGGEQSIAISLKCNASGKHKRWSIGCIDCDLGGIYYKHQLTGRNHKYCYQYKELMGRITTSVQIY